MTYTSTTNYECRKHIYGSVLTESVTQKHTHTIYNGLGLGLGSPIECLFFLSVCLSVLFLFDICKTTEKHYSINMYWTEPAAVMYKNMNNFYNRKILSPVTSPRDSNCNLLKQGHRFLRDKLSGPANPGPEHSEMNLSYCQCGLLLF